MPDVELQITNQIAIGHIVTEQSLLQLPAPIVQPRTVRLWPLWFIIIILVAAMSALAVYGWASLQQVEQLRLQITHIEKDDGSQSKSLDKLENEINKQTTDTMAQGRAFSEQLATHRRHIEHNARQLAQVGGQSRTDWLLAEAEYLMRLANQRLNMEKDFVGAEAILTAANSVLADSDDPGLYVIRQQLAKDILELQRVVDIDREGIYLQIEALIDLIDQFDQSHYQSQDDNAIPPESILRENTAPPIEENRFSQLLTQTLNELKQLVIIRRVDHPVEPLLAPEQAYYLKQNLHLMLEQAELALLDRKQVMYERSLNKAEKWVTTYFTQQQEDTVLLLETLTTLKNKQINPTVPDIS